MVAVREVGPGLVRDLDRLFGSDDDADRCWCMWFLMSVRDFHAAGREGNRRSLLNLIDDSPTPIGLVAYDDDLPVGWCAVGPKQRYSRAVKTPTLRGWSSPDDETTWFLPCLFITPDLRRKGIATALVTAGIEAARQQGATAIESFPLSGDRRRSGGSDLMTGVEPLFADHGFEAVHRPSRNRVVMRLEL